MPEKKSGYVNNVILKIFREKCLEALVSTILRVIQIYGWIVNGVFSNIHGICKDVFEIFLNEDLHDNC